LRWVVIDAGGQPALWQPDKRVDEVSLRFEIQAFAQASADRLNRAA